MSVRREWMRSAVAVATAACAGLAGTGGQVTSLTRTTRSVRGETATPNPRGSGLTSVRPPA